MDKTDSQIVEDCLDGNTPSFELIVNRYLNQVYNFIYRLCGNREESNDISQDVFIKIWKNLGKFDSKQNFKTWIFTIARNATIDWLRKKRNILFSDLDSEDFIFEENIADIEPLQDELFQNKELKILLDNALNKLSFNYREVVLLHLVEGLTFEDISIVIKKPTNTVKSQYRRALIDLRKILS